MRKASQHAHLLAQKLDCLGLDHQPTGDLTCEGRLVDVAGTSNLFQAGDCERRARIGGRLRKAGSTRAFDPSCGDPWPAEGWLRRRRRAGPRQQADGLRPRPGSIFATVTRPGCRHRQHRVRRAAPDIGTARPSPPRLGRVNPVPKRRVSRQNDCSKCSNTIAGLRFTRKIQEQRRRERLKLVRCLED
jgi:hypothetical protein